LKFDCSFCGQDDALIGSMTVRENILYAAHLRLPYSLSIGAKVAKVNEVIEMFGLKKSADTFIGTPFLRGDQLELN
jgi:ATP-binding cassette subfamily G (WHITE) protein 2